MLSDNHIKHTHPSLISHNTNNNNSIVNITNNNSINNINNSNKNNNISNNNNNFNNNLKEVVAKSYGSNLYMEQKIEEIVNKHINLIHVRKQYKTKNIDTCYTKENIKENNNHKI